MSQVLVTGAGGFVGRALVEALGRAGRPVRAAFRSTPANPPLDAEVCVVGEVDESTDWSAALGGVDAVVHLAARAHVMRDRVADPAAAFNRVNVAGASWLAEQAVLNGVRRFVFVSTVKVHGELSPAGRPFTETDLPQPKDAYAASKWQAEQCLQRIAADTGLELVVVRPPLVYGPGVKANFLNLLRWIDRGRPLPLGAVDNRRSLIGLANLVDLLARCVDHPIAARQTFLAADREDLSTADLARRLGRQLGRPARLIAVPPVLLRAGAALTGRRGAAQRLLGSMQVSAAHANRLLNWSPPYAIDEELARLVQWHRSLSRGAPTS